MLKYPLKSIYFYISGSCNLACKHCWIDPNFSNDLCESNFLDFELFCSIVEQAKFLGLVSVKLTGGEPLLHPKIFEILDFIKNKNLRLIVETNGILCTQAIAKKISECKNPFVSVSLDSPSPDTHDYIRGQVGSFSKALEGISSLVEFGIRPQIVMTIMHYNFKDVASMLEFAKKIKASSVKFNLVQPIARGEILHQKGEFLDIDELIKLGDWIENRLYLERDLKIYNFYPLAFRRFKNIFSERSSFNICKIFNILGVLPEGFYALCGIGRSVKELIFGDAKKDSLESVWNNNPILLMIRQNLPSKLKGICSVCIMRNLCLGGCVAANYYINKDILSGFWFCENAESKGLFPKTRKVLQKAVVKS